MCQSGRFLVLVLFVLPASLLGQEVSRVHWAFQKPVRPELPPLETFHDAERVRNPIDQFVLQRLESAGLRGAPQADRTTLVRRAYFDLLGLPPTPDQVAAFVEDDSPEAWTKLIDTLLESEHYGERWGRHWLDVARYADSGGYETDIYYRNAWRYRDYVVKSFNDNKPYNTFVQEQIAGDELWPDNLDLDPRRVYIVSEEKRKHLEARIGTGFYALGPRVHESGLDAKRLAYETLTDWADTTAAAFMGLTLACARCHEHKFDPFTQQDYFSLQAIFAASREIELPLWTPMQEADWREGYPRVVAVEEAREAYHLFESTVQDQELSPEQEAKKQELLMAIGLALLELPKAAAGQSAIKYVGLMHIPTASVLGREHPALIKPIYLLERGEVTKPQEQMQPALPKVLARMTETPALLPTPFGSRKQLALWLTQPEHPLTARVFVNRVWQWHFGRGIVETPNDFGKMGLDPSHPELLDWLAIHFVDDDWNIKNLHRLMMNSATYRQDSRFSGENQLILDPDNRLLWRMNRRRLEAEALWDAVHATAGTLNLAIGGRPVVPPLAEDEIAPLRKKWHWVVSSDPAQHTRRGIYVLVRRNFKFPMFEVFDTPVTSVSCPTRDVTTVAPQALWGLNNKAVFRQAMHLAGRVVKECDDDPLVQVSLAFKMTLGRAPTSEESASALALLKSLQQNRMEPLVDMPAGLRDVDPAQAHALSKLCLTLFNLSEFAFID